MPKIKVTQELVVLSAEKKDVVFLAGLKPGVIVQKVLEINAPDGMDANSPGLALTLMQETDKTIEEYIRVRYTFQEE